MNAWLRKLRSKEWAVRLWNGGRIFCHIFNKKGVLSHASVCGYTTILSLVPVVAFSLAILSSFAPVQVDVVNTSIESNLSTDPNAIIDSNTTTEPNASSIPSATSIPNATTNLSASDKKDFGDEVFDFFFKFFVPVYAQETSEELLKAKQEVRVFLKGVSRLQYIIVIFLVLTSVSVFNSIEHAFHEIWSVRFRRSLYSRFLAFWLLLTLTPLLLGLSYYFSSQLLATMLKGGANGSIWSEWILRPAVSFFLTLSAFLFANRYLPNVKVHFFPSLIASLLSAVMWETAKAAFDMYMSYASKREFYGLFGSYVAIPIFILWLYYSYICFLVGPVIATTIQDYKKHLARLQLKSSGKTYLPLHSLKLYLAICQNFYWDKKGISFDQLEEMTGWETLWIRNGLRNLTNCKLIHQDKKTNDFYPNADPDHLTLGEVSIQMFGFHVDSRDGESDDEFEQQILKALRDEPNMKIQELIAQG